MPSSYNLRIIKDEALVKGVYNNYEEFKNNNPFHKSYDLQNGSLGDMIFVKDNEGKEFPARNVWGYCDGKNAYMKMADNYYKLQRSGNTFILFGAKQITRRRTIKIENVLLLGMAGGGVGKQNKRTTYKSYHQTIPTRSY